MSEPNSDDRPKPQSSVIAALAAFVVECALIAASMTLKTPLAVLLAVHAVVVALLAYRCRVVVRSGGDAGTPVVLAVAVGIAGPFGALAGAALDWLSVQGQEHRDRLARWYDRISLSIETDDVTQLSDNVVTGRSMDLGAPAPPSFSRVIEDGSIGDKQAILGLVARRFHPHYLPALKAALLSPEPIIRVQAAAVAARVRGPLTEDVGRLVAKLAETPPGAAALLLCGEIERCAASGLIEDRQNDAATSAARVARAQSLDALEIAAAGLLRGTSTRQRRALFDARVRGELESKLLAERRYGEFRRLRRAFAFAVKGRMRLRVGQWPRQRRAKRAGATGGAASA